MKISKRLLIGFAVMFLSVSAFAMSFVDKVTAIDLIEPTRVVQLNALPSLSISPNEDLTVFGFHANLNYILMNYYGSDVKLHVNSNNINYRESNVLIANFAKAQNKNFERFRLVS